MTAQSNDMDIDLRSRTVALERQSSDHQTRIGELEKWQRKSEISDARNEEQLKGMETRFNDRFTSVERQITAMSGNVSWLVRLIIGALVGGILSGIGIFIVKGLGINLP